MVVFGTNRPRSHGAIINILVFIRRSLFEAYYYQGGPEKLICVYIVKKITK